MARKLTTTDCLKAPSLPSAYLNFVPPNSGIGSSDVEGWSEMEWQILSALYRGAMSEFPGDSLPE